MIIKFATFILALFAGQSFSQKPPAFERGVVFDLANPDLSFGLVHSRPTHGRANGTIYTPVDDNKIWKLVYDDEVIAEAPIGKYITEIIRFGHEEHSLVIVIVDGKVAAFSGINDNFTRVKVKYYRACSKYIIPDAMIRNSSYEYKKYGITLDFSKYEETQRWWMSIAKGGCKNIYPTERIRGVDKDGWRYIDDDASSDEDEEYGTDVEVIDAFCPYTSLDDYEGDISDIAFIAFQSYKGYMDSDDEDEPDHLFDGVDFDEGKKDEKEEVEFKWPSQRIILLEQTSTEKTYKVDANVRPQDGEDGQILPIRLLPDTHKRKYIFEVTVPPLETVHTLVARFFLVEGTDYVSKPPKVQTSKPDTDDHEKAADDNNAMTMSVNVSQVTLDVSEGSDDSHVDKHVEVHVGDHVDVHVDVAAADGMMEDADEPYEGETMPDIPPIDAVSLSSLEEYSAVESSHGHVGAEDALDAISLTSDGSVKSTVSGVENPIQEDYYPFEGEHISVRSDRSFRSTESEPSNVYDTKYVVEEA
ncbi:hypothetical protein BgAZ_204150 [Babesia gibsoni]|uniref:Uncharacterized protein n=1 Tax=Babesia gibsoni TaxID=33632 RepID=A0AAD8PDX4_BABGI|nr:hypothetical protein BgAZ_204150 [Babesia gibsoni]